MAFHQESTAINRFDPRVHLQLSPAELAPNFGLIEIPWAHQGFEAGEYQIRLQRTRGLISRMNAIPQILRHQLSAQALVDVLSSLYSTFSPQMERVNSLSELIQHPMAGSRLQAMLADDVFGSMPTAPYEPSTNFRELDRLISVNPLETHFNAQRYQELPEELKDFLDGIHLLLVPSRNNPNRVSFTLRSLQPNTPADSRYIRFYEALASLGISSFFSIKGGQSVPDGFLGIYDQSAVADTTKPLFPQYERDIKKQGDQEPDLKLVVIDSRSIGVELSRVLLIDESTGTRIELSSLSSGTVEIIINGQRSTPPDMAKAVALFTDMTTNRQAYPLNTPVTVDLNLLQKTETAFKKNSKAQLKTIIQDPEGGIDSEATQIYHTIVLQLSSGGAIYFPAMKEKIGQLAGNLSREQLDFISLGLTNYTFDAISRGQLGDLEGMDDVMGLLMHNFELYPEIAGRMRIYVDNLPPDAITQIISSFTHEGLVTPQVYNPTISYQSDLDRQTIQHPLSNLIRGRPGFDYIDDFGRPVDLRRHQVELMGRLVDYVQQLLPGIEVDEEIVLEIKKYGEMLQIMRGQSAFLTEEKVAPKLGTNLTIFFEGIVGRQLLDLRRALPYASRQMLTESSGETS